eukprot:3278301-Amphidinium_carterae.1
MRTWVVDLVIVAGLGAAAQWHCAASRSAAQSTDSQCTTRGLMMTGRLNQIGRRSRSLAAGGPQDDLLDFVVTLPWDDLVVSKDHATAFIKGAPKTSPGPDGMGYQR